MGPEGYGASNLPALMQPQPGRQSSVGGVSYQDEFEFRDMCEDRKNAGYNSGMGEIFRKVAAISPVKMQPAIAHSGAQSLENESCVLSASAPDNDNVDARPAT